MASITGLVAIKNCEKQEIPWIESLLSVQNICEHLIIVDGNSTDHTIEIVKSKLDNTRLTILNLEWPQNTNWLQFARSYAYGKEFIKTDWGLFFTYDEIFPNWNFNKLNELKSDINYVKSIRQYVLGPNLIYSYIKKENIFRNIKDITFGIINYKEGEKALFRDFGRLINCSKWYDGSKYIDTKDSNIPYKLNYLELLKTGEVPKGFRENNGIIDFGWEFYNTDVTFCSNEQIEFRKRVSFNNYQTLPDGYKLNSLPNNFLEATQNKIRNLLKNKQKIIKKKLPSILDNYLKQRINLKNIIRDECEKHNLVWEFKD